MDNTKKFWDDKKIAIAKVAVVTAVTVAAYQAGRANATKMLANANFKIVIPDAVLSDAARRFM